MTYGTGAIQTAITTQPDILGGPGREVDSASNDVVSFIANEQIPFGAWVKTTGHRCYLPASATDVTNFTGGIALRDAAKPTGASYEAGDLVRVLRRGRAWALIEEAIADTDALYVRHTAGVGEQKGALRNDADGSDGAIPAGAKWFHGGTVAGGGAIIEVGVGGSAGPTGATGPTGPTGPAGD